MPEFNFPAVITASRRYRITKRICQHWNNVKFSYTSNSRPDHGFLLPLTGRIRFEFSDTQITAYPGDLIFLPKDIRYEACIPPEFGKTEDYLINFDTDTPLPDLPDRPVKLFHAESHELMTLFDRIIQPRQPTEFYTAGLFFLLLDRIITEYAAQAKNSKAFLHQAEELITGRDDLSIREIAGLCGVSESGLRSHFQKVYGTSPQQYRMNTRIDRAKYLLETTNLSVCEIADRLRFYDEAYFCKMFRTAVGCSPKKYAANKTI